jgi:hypothetical protein
VGWGFDFPFVRPFRIVKKHKLISPSIDGKVQESR